MVGAPLTAPTKDFKSLVSYAEAHLGKLGCLVQRRHGLPLWGMIVNLKAGIDLKLACQIRGVRARPWRRSWAARSP